MAEHYWCFTALTPVKVSLFLLYSKRCWCRPQGTVQGLGIPLGEKTQRASLT